MNDVSRAIISEETGECLGYMLPGDKVIHRRVLNKMQETANGRIPFAPDKWGKAYSGAIGKLARLRLTSAEYSIALLMISMAQPYSGLVAYGNRKAVQAAYIVKELGITERTAADTMQKLCDLRVIAKAESGGETQYYANPYICSKGGAINRTLHEMFRKSEWAQEAAHPV